MLEKREYQDRAIVNLRKCLQEGNKRPVMVLSTGGGKSIIFGQIISNVIENGKTILWLVHRRNLVIQMRDSLKEHFDIEPGIIMSGYDHDIKNRVQLCTIQTYARRIKLGDNWKIDADIVLIDEGHRAVAQQYKDVIELYHDKIIMGCTATPVRADQRGLGEVYDSIVEIADVKELTDQGYLAPARYFVPGEIDLEGVKIQGGDYLIKDLEGKVVKTKLIGDIVQNWLELAEHRRTIVYAVNVKHSKALCDEFNKNGIPAEHLDAKSPDSARDAVFYRMQKGETRVICNVALYQEGLDVPNIECVVMARPTKSLGLYRQCIGRGLRIYPGKEDLFVMDHGNTYDEHGPVEWEVQWSLDGKERAWKIKPGKQEKQGAKCRVCHEVFQGHKECPICGTPLKSFGKKILTVEAELAEIEANENHDMITKRLWYGMFLGYALNKGYKKGWAYWKYKEKFKVGPASTFQNNTEPIKPNEEFMNYIKHLNIKLAKRRQKEQAQENLRRGGELINEHQTRL